jgi:hypothetical protein
MHFKKIDRKGRMLRTEEAAVIYDLRRMQASGHSEPKDHNIAGYKK